MKFGDVVLVPFPYAELTNIKIRPAVVIAITSDKYKDVFVAAVSSVVPQKLSDNEILLAPDVSNNLRTSSVLKVDRLVTLKKENIILPCVSSFTHFQSPPSRSVAARILYGSRRR